MGSAACWEHAERNEGLRLYVKSLTWNSYISEFGTPDERNDGRAQETMVLSFIHMETIPELDEPRRETMMMPTEAFNALKQPAGRGSDGIWCAHHELAFQSLKHEIAYSQGIS